MEGTITLTLHLGVECRRRSFYIFVSTLDSEQRFYTPFNPLGISCVSSTTMREREQK